MRALAALPLIRRLLAVLLVVQVVLAPGLCLPRAVASEDDTVEICTAEGLRQVHVALDAGAAQEDASRQAEGKADHDGGGHGRACLVCHALPQATLPEPPILPSPAWAGTPPGWTLAGLPGLPPAIRGPPSGPRAPPPRLA